MERIKQSIFYFDENTLFNRGKAKNIIQTVTQEQRQKNPDSSVRDAEFLDTIVGLIRAQGVLAVRKSGDPTTLELLKGKVISLFNKTDKNREKRVKRKERDNAIKRLDIALKEEDFFTSERNLKIKPGIDALKNIPEERMREAFDLFQEALALVNSDLKRLKKLQAEAKKLNLTEILKRLDTLIADCSCLCKKIIDKIPTLETSIDCFDEIEDLFIKIYSEKNSRVTFTNIKDFLDDLFANVRNALDRDNPENGVSDDDLKNTLRTLLKKRNNLEFCDLVRSGRIDRDEIEGDRSVGRCCNQYAQAEDEGALTGEMLIEQLNALRTQKGGGGAPDRS